MPVVRGNLKRLVSGVAVLCLALILGVTTSGLPSGAVSADSGPDLTVTDISLFPTNPAIGDTATVTATVKNQGTATCIPSSLTGYVDGAIITTLPVNSLGPGQSTTVSFIWEAVPGTHNIKATADVAGTISETDETNNSRTFALTTLASDLTVQAITWTPESPSKGDSVVLNVIVKNQGSLRSSVTRINLYIDGSPRGTQNLYGIDPDGTSTITYNWIAQTGQHTLVAAVDEDDHIVEGDETNNEKTVTFTTLAPDLIVSDITWSPQNPSKNDTVTFDITVENIGSGRADSSLLMYYIDDFNQPLLTVGTLDAGASVNVTFTWTAVPDEHSIRAVADFPGNLAEGNGDNNEKTVIFSTLAPDIIVKDVTWEPQDAAIGDTITLTVITKNLGSGRALAFRAACYIDGKFQGWLDYPALDSGAEATETITWQATSNSHVVSIAADDDDRLKEHHEDNNRLNKTIPLIPPELYISLITWSPENPAIGDTVTITVTVTNQGEGKATNFHTAFFIDDEMLNPTSVAGLSSGSSVNQTCTWTAEAGRHTFRAVADAYSSVPEGNENDNEYIVYITANMPDLAVGSVTWSPADLPAGEQVAFIIEIENLGTMSAGPTRVAYYVDGQVAGYTDIGRIDAGKSVSTEFLWVVAEGTHAIKIVTDASDQLFEIDETNNLTVVNLPPPDLTVADITWEPQDAAVGEAITVIAQVKNQGSGRSTAGEVSCYIDGVELTPQELPEIDPGVTVMSKFAWEAEAGIHDIRIVADDAGRVTEADETNNEREVAFASLTPDLTLEDVGWLVKDPIIGDEVTFNIVVKNRGTGAAAASKLKYVIDGNTTIYKNISDLPAGATEVVYIVVRLQTGPHSIAVTVDVDNDIGELDETNNEEKLDFSTIVPDLVIKSITWEPLDAAPGDPVTVTVKLENRGSDMAVKPGLTLSVDGSPTDYIEIPELDVGGIATVDFTWTALPGLHEITALADVDGVVSESDDTNNSKSRTLEVAEATTPTTSLAGPVTGSTESKGFLGDFWWIAMVVAAMLGVTAFVIAMKSFKK